MVKNGFTLIELIVVIIIIGMASALVLPLISNSFDRLRVSSASRQVAGILRGVRSRAISEKKTLDFTLDLPRRQYSITTGEGETLLTVRRGETPKNVTLKGFSYMADESVENDGVFSLSFFSQGNSTGGNLYLGSDNGEDSFSITVDKISGRVKIKTVEKE